MFARLKKSEKQDAKQDPVTEAATTLESIDVDDLPQIDAEAERKLVRKLDLHIVPVVMLLYLLSFLDR